MNNNPTSVKEIQAAIEQWGQALFEKDLEAMHQDYDPDNYRLFDVGTTMEGVETTKQLWQQCLPFFDAPKVVYQNMVIRATDDMAVAHFNSQVTGTVEPMPEAMQNLWMRGTVCFQKIDGRWLCIHEHISMPVNCETMSVATDA